MKKRPIIKEIDTGDIWECPCCRKRFHLIHRETSEKKVLKHDFEEVIE